MTTPYTQKLIDEAVAEMVTVWRDGGDPQEKLTQFCRTMCTSIGSFALVSRLANQKFAETIATIEGEAAGEAEAEAAAAEAEAEYFAGLRAEDSEEGGG